MACAAAPSCVNLNKATVMQQLEDLKSGKDTATPEEMSRAIRNVKRFVKW